MSGDRKSDVEPEAEAPAPAEEQTIEQPAAEPGEYQVHVAAPVTEDARPEIPDGHRMIVYRGRADVVIHGERRFRPGQPAIVPSEVAEELLTLPFEPFEAIEE